MPTALYMNSRVAEDLRSEVGGRNGAIWPPAYGGGEVRYSSKNMGHWPLQVVFAFGEGVLLLACIYSDLLPRALLSGFLRSHGAAWEALVDNVSHAGIAAVSWAVVVSLSPPPSPTAASFRLIALPASPLHRCLSCALRMYTKAPPTPTPTPTPRTQRRTPEPGSALAEASCGDYDAVVVCQQARPGGEEKGGRSAAHKEAGRKGASASGVVEVAFAACIGSALDLDHFLAAGSLRLSKATGLAGRPWGHCVAALVVAALAVAALTHNARVAASVFSAGLSHQLRDSTRRGLWLYPPRGPKTPPLGYPVYLVAQALLPLLVALCLRGGVVSICVSCVRGFSCDRRRRRRRWPCARRCSGGGTEDTHRSALLPL